MKYKQVRIVWYDAASKAEWVDRKTLPHLQRITTAGYMVRKAKTSITVCGSIHEEPGQEDGFGDCITIPTPWIEKTDA